jgi:hypothetical protein
MKYYLANVRMEMTVEVAVASISYEEALKSAERQGKEYLNGFNGFNRNCVVVKMEEINIEKETK